MQMSPIQRVDPFFRSSCDTPAWARVAAFIATILQFRNRAQGAEDIIAARYQGQAWCDSTERELTGDMRTGHQG